ncbi:dihydroorotate dehydrogenase-like protein [uncultured Imperialibacter sp.]|uniref:dihydroorotate dehydrogenase-like protein n=1 Tax=uncultured Imperialibacter sp. TaxID=1672639 RepID=UPI0030DA08F9|tara:strand:+ start:51824 stop:52864 length:1041 start_codon:yes stop_codon:yes gene_type:complete
MSINLSTFYGGLTLKNPIVVGASNLVTDVDNLVKLEEAGAGAIVYKSLFEEQIQLEAFQLEQMQESYSYWDQEHNTIFPTANHAGPAEHLRQLKEARKYLTIPLIGSLNCINNDSWLKFALKMEDTGIDALELNFYNSHLDFNSTSEMIEARQIKTLELVKAGVRLPVFVKLSPFYSNTLKLIASMDALDVAGFVLFNRLFQPDIDIEKEEHHFPYNFSSESDNRLALRYAGLLHKKIKGSIVCNTGILSGHDVIKMLLAGADAVQVVSAIYKKGIHTVTQMLTEIETWMKKHKYQSLDDFQGKLAKENLDDPFAYKRAQYVDILMKSEVFMKYHPKETDDEAKDD